MRRAMVLALAALFAAAPLAAQSRYDSIPPLVRAGKWVGAAAFAGAITMALVQHNAANRAYDGLLFYCTNANCTTDAQGRYVDPGAEQRYQDVVRGDRAARIWLIAGQVTLVGTAVLFVLELTRERGTTNIPYTGHLLVEPGRVGLRFDF